MKICKYYNFDELDFLTIPDALLTLNRNQLFSTWEVLEQQLEQVDPKIQPEVYNALDEKASIVFAAWIAFRYVGRGG